MERGSLIIVSVGGDHGKPRPAVVIQNDRHSGPDTVLVCLLTSDIAGATESRLVVQPLPETGLREVSVVMTEKIYPISRARTSQPIGRLSAAVMEQVDIRLTFVLGLGD